MTRFHKIGENGHSHIFPEKIKYPLRVMGLFRFSGIFEGCYQRTLIGGFFFSMCVMMQDANKRPFIAPQYFINLI